MSNVIKGNYGYSFRDESTKVIDTNRLVANRLEELSRMVRVQAGENAGFEEGFTQGLEAVAVEKLLADDDAGQGEPSNVIKARPPEQVQLGDAAIEAENIINQANARAQDIIEEARNEADGIRKSAMEEGQRVGFDEGLEQGEKKGREKYEAALSELKEKQTSLERDFDERVANLEPRLAEIFTEIYEHIFHVAFSDHKEVIFYLLQDALRKSDSGKSFIVHVSPADYEATAARRSELAESLPGSSSVELVEDITLKEGECFVDTGSGIFDCSIDTELSALSKELRLLSYSPGGDDEGQ